MGQIDGKLLQEKKGNYFQQQIGLYRWRADSAFNLHLPRVKFCSKKTFLQQSQFQNLLFRQLNAFNYVDISSFSRLPERTHCQEQEQIMEFQTFDLTLDAFKQCLSFEECLYVLQTLLYGYQTIYNKLGGYCVSPETCFVNERGEVRAWINKNYTLNQFEQKASQSSEAAAVNQILRLCGSLTSIQGLYLHFSRQLSQFFNSDMLHHFTFSAAHRFINGYLFTHKLILPASLSHSLKRIKEKKNKKRSISSFSELFQQSQLSNPYFSTKGNLISGNSGISEKSSTQSQSNVSQKSSKNSGKNHSNTSQMEFYRPICKTELKLSNLDINASQKCAKVLTNKSEMLLKKSVQESISSTFSKSYKTPACQTGFTPKHTGKTKSHLYSTGQSFFQQSKQANSLANSQVAQANSSKQMLEYFQSKQKLENTKKVSFKFAEKNKRSLNLSKMQTQPHSKHPSFDQNASSLFISPKGEAIDRSYFSRPIQSKIETVSESELSKENESYVQQGLSTAGQVFPSQMHLAVRHVSGLVEKSDIHVYESNGSFISIERNSNQSEYRGVLLKMGRSAQIVSLPANKSPHSYIKSNIQPHSTK